MALKIGFAYRHFMGCFVKGVVLCEKELFGQAGGPPSFA